MGVIIPSKKKVKINKTDISNISFDPEVGIKNLLMSRQNSVADSNKSSKQKLYNFFRNFLPLPKKKLGSQKNTKSFSFQNKHSKIADINDTIKNIETAFLPKKRYKKITQNQTNQAFLKTVLVKNNNNDNVSRRRDSLFPSFIKKINEYKKHKMMLNGEDLNLFNILKNYFKMQKTNKHHESLPSYELKKNKCTLECLKQVQKEKVDYYVDEIDLPQKRTLKQEISSLMRPNYNNKSLNNQKDLKSTVLTKNLMYANIDETNNNQAIEAVFDGMNLGKRASILKKNISLNIPFHKNRSLSPSHLKNKSNLSESILKNSKISMESEGYKTKFTEPLINNIMESPNNKSDSPIKPCFNKIVLNRCIIPLRLKTTIQTPNVPELIRRKTCFNDQNMKNITIMEPINEESSAQSLKNKYKSQMQLKNKEESSNDSSVIEQSYINPNLYNSNLSQNINKSLKLDEECFIIESPNQSNPKNPARIVKYGKWDFEKYCENMKKEQKTRSLSKNEENRSNSGTPVRKTIRNGKCYNILKKNENLIIRNNKAVQILQEDAEFLERLKKKKWFDGLDHLSKISYKNVSPTMFYFCKNKEEQKKLLNFENI